MREKSVQRLKNSKSREHGKEELTNLETKVEKEGIDRFLKALDIKADAIDGPLRSMDEVQASVWPVASLDIFR